MSDLISGLMQQLGGGATDKIGSSLGIDPGIKKADWIFCPGNISVSSHECL